MKAKRIFVKKVAYEYYMIIDFGKCKYHVRVVNYKQAKIFYKNYTFYNEVENLSGYYETAKDRYNVRSSTYIGSETIEWLNSL